MEWNLLPVLNCDGKQMPVDVSLALDAQPEDGFRILSDVTLRGNIVNVGGSLDLTLEGRVSVERICDRCAEPFLEELVFPVQERLKKVDTLDEGNQDPDILFIEGSSIDLAQLAYSGIYMSLSSKALCRADCKGLCPICGKNQNLGECSCDQRSTDPRFDVLDQLL